MSIVDSQHRLSTQSLSSSRPAPPSPAMSRRASSRLCPSRPTSMSSRLVPSTTLTPTTTFILIRDYGFAQSDPRFTGQGPNVPRANRPTVLARRLASKATTGEDDHEDDDDDDDDEDDNDNDDDALKMWPNVDEPLAWPALRWSAFGRTWGLGMAAASSATPTATGFPTRNDLDRNFGGEDEGEMDMEVDEPFSDEDTTDLPLFPGLYRAMFPFEPEGTSEMKLDEGQVVRVIGKGGGVGWAVVVKDGLKDTGIHALVPESYLELVRLDGEDEDLEC